MADGPDAEWTHPLVVVDAPLDLVVIDGDSSDMSPTGRGNGAHGSARTTSHIQALLAWAKLQQSC